MSGGNSAYFPLSLSANQQASLTRGPFMATGQGWRAFTSSYTPGTSAQYAIYEKVYISDDYWTTNQRFLFGNWWLTNSTSNAETANGNAVQIDIVTMIFTDITGTQRTVTMTFGGSNSVTLTAGGAGANAWTDSGCQTLLVPPNSRIMVRCHRTMITPSSDVIPGSSDHAYNQALGERVQVGTTSMTSLATAGGISSTSPSGNNVYPFGPIAGVAQGWDGREIPIMFGTSIEYGTGECTYVSQPRGNSNHCGERGWFGRGMASTANGAKKLPNINWSVPGATLQGINGTGSGQGIYYRQAALALLTGQRLPFTCVVCSLGTNDVTVTLSTWQSRFTTTWTTLKAAWPVPLIQTEILTRVTSSDGFQTTTNQSPYINAGSYGYPAGASWQMNRWIRSITTGYGGSFGQYIDRSFDLNDFYSNLSGGGTVATWSVAAAEPWTSTFAAASAVNATGIYLASPPSPGSIIAILDSSAGYECGIVNSASYSSGGSCFVGLKGGLAYAHASGVVVKLSPSFDGTHPGPFINQFVADGGVANAKIAGVFKF